MQALLGSSPAGVPVRVWRPAAASAPKGFRNKAKMVVSGQSGHPVLGILGPDGKGVDLRRCPLHVPEIRSALPVLARAIARTGMEPYDVPGRRGELKHLLVTASPDGELMVRTVLRSRRHLGVLRQALPRLRAELPALRVLSANIQPVHQAVIEGPEEIVLTEGSELLMRLSLPSEDGASRPLPLHLPTRSFFQTNTSVAEQLYATARHWALTPPPSSPVDPIGTVWDLFCGVGGFALALAGEGRRVRGVEISAPAVDGARRSAALMGLREDQAHFEVGDARVLDPSTSQVPDLLVVNPPRRGLGAELAARIEGSRVPRVLYSSCNPTSLATDLVAMPSLSVRRARLFDMFPHTDHSEVLVELVRDPAAWGR